MGAPETGMQAGEQPAAETLLTSFKTISAAERRKHASVLNYWLSIRGDKEFPPLHDLDPLEISDAGRCSALLELISGGHDADIRHLGEALKSGPAIERIMDAAQPSLLASIARKLPIVAISRDFMAFEDEFTDAAGTTRCWVTLLPLSAGGAWVDYVYAVVSVETEAADEPAVEMADVVGEEAAPEEAAEPVAAEAVETEPEPALEEEAPSVEAMVAETEETGEAADEPAGSPGFSRLIDKMAGLTGFYGQSARAEPAADELPEAPAEPAAAAEPADHPAAPATEAQLQIKLDDVRTIADEARAVQLQANSALYRGLGAAYDFALDAEDSPEDYLRLVEAKGLKIQLRSPMAPVVRLAFDGLCDEATIGQLEAVLAWALKQDLPRGSLPARIEEAGGIGRILNG